MKREQFEVLRGSGNVYRDLGKDNVALRKFEATLATEIIKVLDRDGLSVRRAEDAPALLRRISPASATLNWAVSRLTG